MDSEHIKFINACFREQIEIEMLNPALQKMLQYNK